MWQVSNKVLKEYLKATTFHGFAKITDENLHWTERLFWSICCTLSLVASTALLITSYNNLHDNAVSFAVETSYLNWTTKFPAIYLCEKENERILHDASINIFGADDENMKNGLKEIIYFDGKLSKIKELCLRNESICLNSNEIYTKFRKNCNKLMIKCTWKNVVFNCCNHFKLIATEFGTCYGLNSIQTKNFSVLLNTNSSEKLGLGQLHLEINGTVHFYIKSEEDVPIINSVQADVLKLEPGYHYKRYIKVNEVLNDEKVLYIDKDLRKCIFPDEVQMGIYPHYSYTACLVKCRRDLQMKLCNCIHNHLKELTAVDDDDKAEICLAKDFDCLSKSYLENVMEYCNCLPSCTEMDVSTVYRINYKIPENVIRIEVILNSLPTEKFRRYVVKDKLDLVVIFGGSFALFLGGSILSFIEFFYYFTIRLINDYILLKDKK